MDENEMNRELEALETQFGKAGKTVLPSSLRSEDLFAKMDAGELRLTQEAAPAAGKVLHGPWRRYGTLAAALLVVIGLYAAGRNGLLDAGDSFDVKSAGNAAPTAMPENELPSAMSESAPEESMAADSFCCTGTTGAGSDNGMLSEKKNEEAGASGEASNSSRADKRIAAALPILDRQSWEARGATEADAYHFTIDGTDYGFDADAFLIVNYTTDEMSFLSDDDCAALLELCEGTE